MRNCRHWKLTVAVASALSAAAALAQGQGGVPGVGLGGRMGGDSNDPSYLLVSESVQKELALTDDQKTSLQKLRDDQTGGQAFFSQFRGLSQDEMQKRLQERAKETRNQISKILAPKQMERLAEINIQMVGPVALNFEDVAEKIGLTADQKEKLKNLGDETHRKLAELNSTLNGQPPTGEKRKERQQKFKEIASDRKDKAIALLTDDQKAKFKQLQGEKFDTSTIQPARGSFRSSGQINGRNLLPPPGQQPGA